MQFQPDLWPRRLRHFWYRVRCYRDLSATLTAYEAVFQELLAEVLQAHPEFPHLTIEFGWRCRFSILNAEAWQDPGSHQAHVRVWTGAFSELQGLSNMIFASSDRFSAVGDATSNKLTFAEVLDAEVFSRESHEPIHPVRYEASCIVTEYALCMIAAHEIAHHLDKHFQWCASGYRMAEHQRQHRRVGAATARIRQGCELDADRFAFSYVLDRASRGLPAFGSQLVGEKLQSHLFELAGLAYALTLALLHDREASLEEYECKGHPHPAVRLYASRLAFKRHLALRSDAAEDFEQIWAECQDVIALGRFQKQTVGMLVHEPERLHERMLVALEALAEAKATRNAS